MYITSGSQGGYNQFSSFQRFIHLIDVSTFIFMINFMVGIKSSKQGCSFINIWYRCFITSQTAKTYSKWCYFSNFKQVLVFEFGVEEYIIFLILHPSFPNDEAQSECSKLATVNDYCKFLNVLYFLLVAKASWSKRENLENLHNRSRAWITVVLIVFYYFGQIFAL